MNSMLHETIASGTGRHADLPGWPAAGKTGTSQDYRDAWFVGYTSHMVTGIWLGNDDNSPTRKAVGGGLPVDVWSRFMRAAHQGVAPSALPGAGGGSPITSLFQSAAAPPAGGRAPQSNQEGLDSWLLDKLFGRH
jgi:penicillin-binding protein 1A